MTNAFQISERVLFQIGSAIVLALLIWLDAARRAHTVDLLATQFLEDIEILFPTAKVARMDLDSTRSKYAYKQLIDDFEAGTIDILVGTQMIAKDCIFPT